MEQTAAPPQPPPLNTTTAVTPAATTTTSASSTTITTTTATYPDSVDPWSRSCNTDSWAEDNYLYPSNNGSTVAVGGLNKLRLMCSYGGHIVPRPHDKSLCYVGGDTRIVVVDRHTTLSDLTHHLAKSLLRSSISSTTDSFTLKYQLPSEDIDSLISVTTDEDLENMMDEYERLNSSSDFNKSSRLRLFLFPSKRVSVSSIGSLLERTTKSEDWFLNALNGTSSGLFDTSSVNCLLGLEEDVAIPDNKDVNNEFVIGKTLRGNNSVQDVQSVPDSPMLETSSSFGSASSSPSLANLPQIRVNLDDQQKGGGIEEHFSQMNVQQQHLKHQEDVSFVAAPAPVVITGVPIGSKVAITENPNRVISEDERLEQSNQMAYRKQQQQQQPYQQKQSMAFDLASPDSISSDGSATNPLSRPKPPVNFQDSVVQTQISTNINTRAVDPSSIPDQNTRILAQQQQIQDPASLMSTPTTQVDTQHPQLHHQPQFIHTAVPPPQYIHHHPSRAIPIASYYQMYPSQSQHHTPHTLDQSNFVYYMPARQQPRQGYSLPLQADASLAASAPPRSQVPTPSGLLTTPRTIQPTTTSESPAGMYRTTNSGAPAPQYAGYSSHIHQPKSVASGAGRVGGTYTYGFDDPSQQGQHIYYASQPMPPQSAAQYQTMTLTLPVETGSHLQTDK